jgi:hypothetical protein
MTPTRKIVLTLGLAAGAVVVGMCCVCGGWGGVIAYRLTVPPDITGRWTANLGDQVYEFRPDGTGTLKSKHVGDQPFKYRFVNFSDMTLTFEPAAAAPAGEVRYQVSYLGEKMHWESLDRPGFFTHLERLR